MNVAGQSLTFAAGGRAKAIHQGAFVWADSTVADFASTANNQFLIRASGYVGINKNNPAQALDVNGNVAATAFFGSGANLTGIGPSALADNSVTSAKLVSDPLSLSKVAGGWLYSAGGNIHLNTGFFLHNNDIYLANDYNHGLGWHGFGKLFAGINVDGPVLYGCSGGGLGTMCGSGQKLALQWNSLGNVIVDPGAANAGALEPGLTFGPASGEGIASKRTAGGNQFGLDFYTSFQNRMTILQNGNVGIGTLTPSHLLHVGAGSVPAIGQLARNAETALRSCRCRSVHEAAQRLTPDRERSRCDW